MLFNIIGAGRLGKTIAQALLNLKNFELGALCCSNFANSQGAIEQIGSGIAVAKIKDLPAAELIFITTPDDVIPLIVNELVSAKQLTSQCVVVHCSGALPAMALAPLKDQGCYLASFHPLKAFKDGKTDKESFHNCDCVTEGDVFAVELICSIFKQLDARIITINPENKTLYHAAAALAANYLVTLASTAMELFNEAGIPSEMTKQITTNLMTSSLNNIQQAATLAEALTGPLQRGDINTLTKHLDALQQETTKKFYCSAGLATLPLTNLSDTQKSLLARLFSTTC